MQYPQDPSVGLQGGKFVDNLSNPNQQPSRIPASWANALTDELLALLLAGGQAPSENNLTQVRDAILGLQRDVPISAGTGAAYTMSLPAYSEVDGRRIQFLPHAINAVNATIDVNGLGSKALVYMRPDDGVLVNVTPGIIRIGRPAELVYMTGQYVLINPFTEIDLVARTAFPGEVRTGFISPIPAGWIALYDGLSVGSAASGAGYANDNAINLYKAVYDSVGQSWAPVTGGRGGDAVADFNADKPLLLPYTAGRVLGISGNGSGLTVRSAGEKLGAETHTLTEGQLPSTEISFRAGLAGSDTSSLGADAAQHGNGSGAIITPPGFGNDESHNNMQPSIFMRGIIKL